MEGLGEAETSDGLLGLRSDDPHARSHSSQGCSDMGECGCDGDCECGSDDGMDGSLPVLSFEYSTLGPQAASIGTHPTPVPDDTCTGGGSITNFSLAAADATLLLAASRTMTTRAPARRAPARRASAVSPLSPLAAPGTRRLPTTPTTVLSLTSPTTNAQLSAPSFDHMGSANVSAPGSSLSPPAVLDSYHVARASQPPRVFQFDRNAVASASAAASSAASPASTTSSLPASPAAWRGPVTCPKCTKTIDYEKKKAFNHTRQCCAACAKRELRRKKRQETTAGGGITTRGDLSDATAPATQRWLLGATVGSQVASVNKLHQCDQCSKPFDNGNRRYNKRYQCCTYCARSIRRRERKTKSVNGSPSLSPSPLVHLDFALLQP